jgi:hypothetical protein
MRKKKGMAGALSRIEPVKTLTIPGRRPTAPIG